LISPGMVVRDIDPVSWSVFSRYFPALSRSRPQAVLWHEDGIPRKFVLGGEDRPFGLSRITDARLTAKLIHDNNSYRVRRVIVTDHDGYESLCEAQNLPSEPDEPRYSFLGRVIDTINSRQSDKLGIYPPLTLDRGPVDFQSMSRFMSEAMMPAGTLFLSVFNGQDLSFSLVALAERGLVTLVTSLEHFASRAAPLDFSAESLDRVVDMISADIGRVAGGLFIQERDFARLFDGFRHAEFPPALILGGQAFGFSELPGVPEDTFLHASGLFAYVPDWIY
jgi:hypothetical protein